MIERTLVLIKPDGVQRALMGRILQRFEDAGLKIVAMKMNWIDHAFAKQHYFDVEERHGPKVFQVNADYLTQGPVLAMILEGVSAISNVRKIVGDTPYPDKAPPGTIRGDFAHVSKDHANTYEKQISNLIHASSSIDDAKREISLWFSEKEIHSYKTVHEHFTT